VAKDPYELLGVNQSAGEAEIKKAYRRLAKKLHPDANPGDARAEARFKEVAAAYNLLSNPELKKAYDSGQVDASGQQQSPFAAGGFDPDDFRHGGFQFEGGSADEMAGLLASLFGMDMGARTDPRRSRFIRPQKGADVRYALAISFAESLTGGRKRVRMGNGRILDIKIPEGVEDGTTLRLRGEGEAGRNGGQPGDAKVDITVQPHKYFTREGHTLRLTLPVTLREAVQGGRVVIPMPTGDVSLRIPAGTNSGRILKLRGKGVRGGDLLVTTQIVVENLQDKGLVDWVQQKGRDENFNPREKIRL